MAYIPLKIKLGRWPIFGQKQGLTPLEKSHFFDFFNFLFLYLRKRFFGFFSFFQTKKAEQEISDKLYWSIERRPDLLERSKCHWRLLSLENVCMCSTQKMYVVVQIYPWFYSLPYMTTDTQQHRKIKFKPRIKLNQNMNTQEGKHFYFNFLK